MRSLYTFLFLPATISAVTLDCKHIRADGKDFDLSVLGGRKSVNEQVRTPPSITNTTFTVDICRPLERLDDIPLKDQCESGTRICGIERVFNDGTNTTQKVIAIAGEYTQSNGRHLDAKFSRLKDGASNEDAGREGLRAELHGGKYGKRDQMAYIEFICDKEWTGNEGFEEESKVDKRDEAQDGDDNDDDKLPDLDAGKAITLNGYKPEGDVDVLRLTWKTKYACEDAADNSPSGQKGSWGFFTWFLIILFLLAASYIIFGSWLNYNRYGARGWDLVPHGDTIRDLPYIVKDFAASMMDKLRGGAGSGPSRGGYSAV